MRGRRPPLSRVAWGFTVKEPWRLHLVGSRRRREGEWTDW